MALAEKIETTRRGFLVRAGAGVAGAAALAMGGPAAALAAPQTQAAGSTLRLNLGSEPDTIDPQKASFVGEISVIMRVFRNLLQFDADTNLIPDMATDMPQVSTDGTQLTFTLKDGIQFSDGVPITAMHFEYAWKRHLDPAVAGEYAFLGYQLVGGEAYNTADTKKLSPDQLQALRDAVGVKALDNKTVQFTMVGPAAWFPSVLATWCGVPTREDLVLKGNGGTQFESKWTEPATYVGNGPYKLASWDHQNRMTFNANPGYLTPPLISSVDLAMINEPAVAFAAYLNDELDATGYQREDKPKVESDPKLKAQSYETPSPLVYYLGFNTQKPPFDNQKVRAAFSYGLDRIGFVRDILGGQGYPARQFVPPGSPGHFDYELEEQVFNPTIGQQLLADAGFPGGKGLPDLKWTYASSARMKSRVEALTSDLKKNIGVDIALDPVEPKAYTALVKKPETTPQMFFLGWQQDYPDPQDWYSIVFKSNSTVTHVGWKNVEYDKLCDQADAEQDPAQRRALYQQAAQILINDYPVAFLYFAIGWSLVKPRVQGYKPIPGEYFFGERQLATLKIANS